MNSDSKVVRFREKSPDYITKLDEIPQLSSEEKGKLREVEESFRFRTNEYYQSLIDWNDPNDPIRRIAMPQAGEIDPASDWSLDASGEDSYTIVPGLQHKYENTALLLINDVCGAYCRFGFRKRLFMRENGEVTRDISAGIEYIKAHSEITNVLLTGGDPLILSTEILEKIIGEIRKIDHVKIIRIGSKTPAFNPFRILGDPSLLEMLSRHSTPQKRIYLMAHFNHPRELTDVAVEAHWSVPKSRGNYH
jgi:KamA family protein